MTDTLNDSMAALAKTALGVKAERDQLVDALRELRAAEIHHDRVIAVSVGDKVYLARDRLYEAQSEADALLAKHGKA